MPSDASLASLPSLLRDEPALELVGGRAHAVLAVPEAARAIAVAGLARRSAADGRHPILVATPTGTAAERLAADLAVFLGADDVELFPAWETLPFERVSPSVETMGRRLRVLWRLRDPERAPLVIVASVRALLQRLGPHVEDVEPVIVRPGGQLDPDALLARLVALGYRREELVEHRGEVARRGSIIDVYPSTGDAPVRIDLWGDEVDRLTDLQRQRPALDRATSTRPWCSRPASCWPPTRCGPGPPSWSASSPGAASSGSAWPRDWSSTAWSAGCRG